MPYLDETEDKEFVAPSVPGEGESGAFVAPSVPEAMSGSDASPIPSRSPTRARAHRPPITPLAPENEMTRQGYGNDKQTPNSYIFYTALAVLAVCGTLVYFSR